MRDEKLRRRSRRVVQHNVTLLGLPKARPLCLELDTGEEALESVIQASWAIRAASTVSVPIRASRAQWGRAPL